MNIQFIIYDIIKLFYHINRFCLLLYSNWRAVGYPKGLVSMQVLICSWCVIVMIIHHGSYDVLIKIMWGQLIKCNCQQLLLFLLLSLPFP